MRVALLPAVLTVTALAACDGTAAAPDLAGWYQVTASRRGDCGMTVDDTMPPPASTPTRRCSATS